MAMKQRLNDKAKIVGLVYTTNEGYDVSIIDYIDTHNVLIKFIDYPDLQLWSTMQNIQKGQIKNPYHKSVYGIGYYGVGCYTGRPNALNNIIDCKTEQYKKWHSMFVRCYSDNYHKKEPQYIGCSVAEEFHNYQNFAQWYDRKKYECSYPLELDKDLLIRDNRIYSPHTCCLIPEEINSNLNYTRDDTNYMDYLYQKYKHDVPFYIRQKLLHLSQGRE